MGHLTCSLNEETALARSCSCLAGATSHHQPQPALLRGQSQHVRWVSLSTETPCTRRSDATPQIHSTGVCTDSRSCLLVGCNTADSQHWSVLRLTYMLLVPRRSDATPKLTSWGVLCRSDATPQIHSTGLCSDSRSCCQCLEFFIKPQA